MNMEWLQASVGQLVRQNPARAKVFDRLGLDYCCHGKAPLAQACREKNLNVEKVLKELEVLDQSPPPAAETDWSSAPLTALIDHIVNDHHSYLRAELPRLDGLLEKVRAAHGNAHPELAEIQRVYRAMADELASHMLKEERVLFPLIRSILAENDAMAFHCGGIENPIRVMEHEHDQAGQALSRIRFLTNDYQLPAEACHTYRALYIGLQSLEQDLHIHIHKENNILFPRASDLRAESCAGTAES